VFVNLNHRLASVAIHIQSTPALAASCKRTLTLPLTSLTISLLFINPKDIQPRIYSFFKVDTAFIFYHSQDANDNGGNLLQYFFVRIKSLHIQSL